MAASASDEFERLLCIMATLRGPDGCPWDREQTPRSLLRSFLEECYEVADAIDAEDPARLCEELGDLMLHAAFQARLAEEAGLFGMADALRSINEKLVRRHPHVFDRLAVSGADEVLRNWEDIKAQERRSRGAERGSVLDGVPSALPALLLAESVQKRAARVGFDWPSAEGALEKVPEEVRELAERARAGGEVEDELGDVLFSIVNVARHMGVSPETALRRACAKFAERFRAMECLAADSGRPMDGMSLAELDRLWSEVKAAGGGTCGSTSS